MNERDALDAILEIVREFDLDALRVRVGGATYELVARSEAPVVMTTAAAHVIADSLPAAAAAVTAPPKGPTAATKTVTAPIIGVFYRSGAPGMEAFVEIGDHVEVGQVLCILEAMKLMNEITSDHRGVVRRILPENGALVSLGEDLFWIEP